MRRPLGANFLVYAGQHRKSDFRVKEIIFWHTDVMTYCDAERAINDASYKSLPNDALEKLEQTCLTTGARNPVAAQRIQGMAKVLRTELDERRRNQQGETLAKISTAPQSAEETIPVDGSKETVEWDELRLIAMIRDGIEESLTVEYKAAGAVSRQKTDEITKDVSAFANSIGGRLIYGIREHQDAERKHLPNANASARSTARISRRNGWSTSFRRFGHALLA